MYDVLQLWDFELFHTLDGEQKVSSLLKANLFLIYQGRINRIHSFSPPLSLCICMVFICMVQCLCFALIARRWSATHKYTCLFSSVTLCLSRHMRWSCTAPSEGHVWYLPTPLFLFSLSLYPSFSLALSLSTASSLEKASPLPEGRSRSLRSNRSYSGSSVAVVRMTPLSFIPGAKIIKYLGIINMFFIRETTSLREVAVSLFLLPTSPVLRNLVMMMKYYYYY